MCGAKKNTQVGSTQAILSISSSSYKYFLISFPPFYLACLLFWGYPQAAIADVTTTETTVNTKRFLGYSEAQQHWWYVGAFTALGHMGCSG